MRWGNYSLRYLYDQDKIDQFYDRLPHKGFRIQLSLQKVYHKEWR